MLDVEQIKRVFVNLIDNALAALTSVSSEKQITIVTSHDAERSLLRAEVADSGQGMSRVIFADYSNLISRDAIAAPASGSPSCSE